MVLYLQWWGSYPETKEMDQMFFSNLDRSKKLLYIPTAMIGSFSYEECYSYVSGIVASLWLSIQIEMISNLNELLDKDLWEYWWIYIGGGNTFRLLHEIKKNNLDLSFQKYLKEGWSICWWSAWAIVFWKNIDTSPDANIVNLKNTDGMNMVKWCAVWCHYKPKEDKQIIEYIKYHDCVVIALTETSGLKIMDNDIVSIGDGVILFSKHSKTFIKCLDYLYL